MNRSKIEWCDHTFNMITGCLHGCDYCYARMMAQRFGGDPRRNVMRKNDYEKVPLHGGRAGFILENPMLNENGQIIVYPFGFEPTLHLYRKDRLDELKRGNKIFVGAMADVFGEWVPDEWIQEVFEACDRHPLNNYLFLTKNPERYLTLLKKDRLPVNDNFWYGATVTDETSLGRAGNIPVHRNFLSIEPILESIQIPIIYLEYLKWIIIGAETGRRKGKVKPDPEWIKSIVSQADRSGIPVFMKDSLIPIVGDENMRREYPKELMVRKMSPKMESRLVDNCCRCGKRDRIQNMVRLQAQTLRSSTSRTYGYMCWECFGEHCKSLGLALPDIPDPRNRKETR